MIEEIKQYYVVCDKCWNQIDDLFDSEREALKNAIKCGWYDGVDELVCFSCYREFYEENEYGEKILRIKSFDANQLSIWVN